MTTDLFAPDTAVDRIPLFQARGATSTASGDEYGGREIGQTIAISPQSDVRWEIRRPPYAWATFTEGFNYLSVIEPILVQGEGIEFAVQILAKRLARIPDVLAVSYSTDRNIHLVWTFIRQRNKEVRRQVYRQELQLMREFPDITFDFNVVALDQVEERPLLPDDLQGWIVFYREPVLI
ncbi:MAG: hypothetical protein O6929_01725 [candidate division NC10 bacterium]|nr:hypothetical protein [candidate division NC10 bacterium]